MRVAMLSVHTCPLATLGGKDTGGMNVYVRELSRELAQRGIEVDVFTRSQDPTVPRISHHLGERARVIHLPAGPERPYSKYKVFDHLPQFVDEVLRFAQEQEVRYDVIHGHYWLSGWVAYELRHHWRAPIVQMFHTLGHLKNQIALRPEEKEPPRRIQVETEIVQFADLLIAASPLERAQLIWLYGADPERIRIIPCGVDTTVFYPRPRSEARSQLGLCPKRWMILFVGRIEPLKGIDTLLRAIARLADRYPDWRERICTTIIGGDPDLPLEEMDAEMRRLQLLREELGIGDLVTFIGKQDQEGLPWYYSAADVVVVPSHYESFGLVALEAMACGTPVIASRVGGLSYLIRDGETGFLIPERDPEALAQRLSLLLDDTALREQLGSQAVAWARNYRWERIADQIEEVYQEAIAERYERSKITCRGCS